VRACSPLACLLLVIVTAALALLLYAWVASWIGRTLAWADNMTGWLLADATEKICRGLTGTPPR
jgi:phosphotransferase system  glucose/maltose/N-acetylglucosamine-specific IIC component